MPDFNDSSDFLNNSSILKRGSVNRQHFDPTNPEHLESLKTFVKTGNWGKVQFFCEYPFSDVPMTVLMKFAGHHLQASRRKTGEEDLVAKILAGESILNG